MAIAKWYKIDFHTHTPASKCFPDKSVTAEKWLENSLIYNLIVKSIRKMKNKRQIIIVTHNPNIPVLGDAEGIIILDRNAEGKVDFRKNKKTGCLDEGIIREGICEIMEGGEGAFRKREEKYLYK